MSPTIVKQPISLPQTIAVLIGFLLVATLLSLLLLKQSLFFSLGLDFFPVFWLIITGWYALQIYLIAQILKSKGWSWEDIGFSFRGKRTRYLFGGYAVVALGLFLFIELTLAHAVIDPEKWNALPSLTPKTTVARLIFMGMALVGGVAEEIVYRGFAIQALLQQRLNQWLAVGLASLPFVFQHGLKSVDQFGWFLTWGLVFGVIYVLRKKLYLNIAIHWLVVLSAMLAVLQVLE